MPPVTVSQAFVTALEHHQAGRLADAETLYRRILGLQPNHPGALHFLGVVAHQVGRSELAVELIRRAILAGPDDPVAHSNLGEAHRTAGRAGEAMACYRRAIELDPNYVPAHYNLANILRTGSRLEEAEAAYRQALALDPNHAEAHNNLGLTLARQNRSEEAVAAYRRALEVKPSYAEAHVNLGNALWYLRKSGEAQAAYRRAIELRPDLPEAHNNLGNFLKAEGRFEEAVPAYRRAIQLKESYAEAHSNLGATLFEQGEFAEAEMRYRRALQLEADCDGASLNYALLLLLRGDFHQGWPLFEKRWSVFPGAGRVFSQPRWDGRPLHGQQVLVHAEQGFGDSIQFVRYARMIVERGGVVIVECQPSLATLLRGAPGVSKVVPFGEALPAYDWHLPMLSQPFVFQTTAETIPREGPYLFADPNRCEAWRARLGGGPARLKVGIAWAGDPKHGRDRARSLSLPRLLPLLALEGVDFFSLQKGSRAADIGALPDLVRLTDHTAHLHDFADTAAFVTELDLVISVDTAVAHLAGALGRPVWLLLPSVPDWRWGLAGEQTPWYPTMRLFRQSRVGDWEEVAERVAAALRDFKK